MADTAEQGYRIRVVVNQLTLMDGDELTEVIAS